MNGTDFSLGKALFLAYKSIIHVGMEVWNEITRFDKGKEKVATFQAIFHNMWIQENVFAKGGSKPQWKLIPPDEFLPQHLALNIQPSVTTTVPVRPESTEESTEGSEDQTLDDAINQLFQSVQDELNNGETVERVEISIDKKGSPHDSDTNEPSTFRTTKINRRATSPTPSITPSTSITQQTRTS